MRMVKAIKVAALVALTTPMVMPLSARAMEAVPVAAVWNEQQIDFVYIGRTSFYSCNSLEYKIERILKEVGAREDLQVRTGGCWSQFSPETFTSVRITVAVPKVTAPGAGLEPDEKSRRELVAKVRGESADVAQTIEPFPATWNRIRFTDRSRILDDGDCELLEQLEARVFPKLDIRVIKDSNSCFPGQVRLGQLDLEVEALKALPTADEAQ